MYGNIASSLSVLAMAVWACLPAISQAFQDDELSVQDQSLQLVQEGLSLAAKAVFEFENAIEMEAHRKFFELDNETMAKLRVLSNKLIERQMEDCTEAICKERARIACSSFDLEKTFTINGEKYTPKGVKETPPLVSITIAPNRGSFEFRANTRSKQLSMQFFRMSQESGLIRNKRYQKLLESGNGKSVADFQRSVDLRVESNLLNIMNSIVCEALRASDSQEKQLKKWLATKVGVKTGQTVLQNAKSNLIEINELPDFLSDTQKNAWRLMIVELKVR